MGLRCPGAPPRPPPPANLAAAVPAAGRWLPRLAAAPRTDCPLRCRSQSCPCATAPPAVGRARLHCWSVPPRPPAQRSIVLATTSSAPDTAPLLCGPGFPAHAAATAPTAPGAGSSVAAALLDRTPRLGSGATGQKVARFRPAPTGQSAPPPHRGPPGPGSPVSGGRGTPRAPRQRIGYMPTSGPPPPPLKTQPPAALPPRPPPGYGRPKTRSAWP